LTRNASAGYIVVPKEIHMLNDKVLSAIQDVRPSLQADGGDIELVSVSEDGIVNVRLTGACGTCPMSTMTLKMGVENYLKKMIPEVKEVVQVQ
jgi:Fe-S cluster biogenesis protein NfuA